jgi:phenylacetate-CoA ligase
MFSEIFWWSYIRRNQLQGFWRELERFETLPPAKSRRELGGRLLDQLRYFGGREDALPEWREAASIRDAEELWRIWPSLPVVTKADLVNRFDAREMASRFHLKGKINSTGGSTGEPTSFFHDEAMTTLSVATSIYCWRRMGWRPGVRMVCIWGSDRDIGKAQQSRNRWLAGARNEVIIPGYEINQGTADRVLEEIRKHGRVAIFGFTSLLEGVARLVLECGATPAPGRVSTAWNGGEMLFESQSELFRRAFGVPILNCYGGRELSIMAYQPAGASKLHLVRPYLFAEILGEGGRPAGPGESGRLVLTSTVCRGTPFLRYEVGDLAAYAAEDRDESGIRAVREIQGRTAGLLRLPGGKTINCLYWNHLFKEFPEVQQFQVAVRGGKELEIRLRGTAFGADREAHLRRVVHEFTGGMPVSVTWMERIPLTSQGKLVQVVRE